MPAKKPNKKRAQKKELSTVKRIFIVLGALFALMILIPLVITLVTSLIPNLSLEATLLREVTNARETKVPAITAKRTAQIEELGKNGVIKSSLPLYASFVDGCYIDSTDAGWIAQNHNQKCYIRYIDVFETTMSAEAYDTFAASDKKGTTPDHLLLRSSIDAGSDTYSDGGAYNAYAGYLKATEGKKIARQHTIPERRYGDRVAIYAWKSVVSDLHETGNLGKVTADKNYILLVGDYSYYEKDIGCKKEWIFCGQPIEKPVFGKDKQ